jgi:hypothetical protein
MINNNNNDHDDKIKSRGMRWVWYVAHTGEMRNANKLLVGKPGGRRPLDNNNCDLTYNL